MPGTRAMALHIMVEENAAMIITTTIPNVVLQKKKKKKKEKNINNNKHINNNNKKIECREVYARKPSSLLIDYGDADHSFAKKEK